MLKTGFYDIALRKASERRQLANDDIKRKLERMKKLKIEFKSEEDKD
jgi:hypothetical protein